MTARPAKSVLDNGVRVLTKPIPHVHSVSMGVWVNAGARDELPDESGISHFIEHMIFKGTGRRTAYQIAKEFDAIGGQTNAFTSMEITCYHAKVVDTHLGTMVDILSDIFLNSVFDPVETDKERPVIMQEIGMVEDTPEEFVHTLLGKAFWGEHALGRSILGTRRHIAGFQAEQIKEYFHRLYQPDRIVISAVGNIDHNHFLDLVGPLFEGIRMGDPLPRRIAPAPLAHAVIHKRELEQTHVCLGAKGLKTTDDRRYAFALMNTIMGGNMSSRLFQEIREKRGLAYSVYSFINSYADAGLFGIYAGVSPSNIRETVDLLQKALREIGEKPIRETELQDAKEYTKGGIMLSSESTDNQMVRLAQNEIHFGRDISIQEIIDNIDAVRVEDILALGQDLLAKEAYALTVLGPVDAQTESELAGVAENRVA